MLRLLHLILLRLPPETAHGMGVLVLRLYQWWKRLFGRPLSAPAIRIAQLPRIRFRSRLGLAAGFDKDAEVFPAMAHLGFGFVEVGTVTPLGQPGNPRPRLFRVPGGLVNRMGFNNVGVNAFVENIRRLRPSVSEMPLFANIGKNKDTPLESAERDYEILFQKLEGLVDGFVVNISSPNTAGLRDLQTEDFLEKVARVAPSDVPVLVKLAPDLSMEDLKKLLVYLEGSERFSGAVLGNTSREIAERLGFESGGYSGETLFETAVERVSLARETLKDKLLIGVGGVDSPERAMKMRNAGADLVEIYTSFVYQGAPLVRRLEASLIG